MGYSTNFTGQFKLDKELTLGLYRKIKDLYDIERTGNNEWPDSYCQWIPTDDGMAIEWDGGEKFYEYIEWLQYIIDKILVPNGFSLSGSIGYQGEEAGDCGTLTIEGNMVAKIEFKAQNASIETLVRMGLQDDDNGESLYYLKKIADIMKLKY